jgi:Protein of unknown function (DUF4236)
MSFYVRKSIKAGPLRVNLSKSGIGVSGGMRGLRLGAGPRGTYVRMGRDGVYYWQTLSPGRATRNRAPARTVLRDAPTFTANDVLLEPVTGATTAELSAASSSDLVRHIDEAAGRMTLFPLVVLLCLPVVTIPLAIWVHARDKIRRTVVAFYDVNDEAAVRFQNLVNAFAGMQTCSAQWHVMAQGDIYSMQQFKVHSGAARLLGRVPGVANLVGPPILATNIAVPSLHTPKRSVYFLPDRILVREGKRYADVPYGSCDVAAGPTRFIEEASVPKDAVMVGTTWKYVNKGGGPDRRYKNNRQLPIMQYGEMVLSSISGFRCIWQTSRSDSATSVADAISSMRLEPAFK